MSHTYDVAIIGAGTAGLAALREARRHTDNLVIINDGHYGTTCARVGCMPSKALIESANAFHRRVNFAELAIDGGEHLRADVAAVLERVRRLRDHFTKGIIEITTKLGERSIQGRARFIAPDTLDVAGRQIRARHIVIATGSRPIVPPEWRAFGNRIITTDTLFEQRTLPTRLAVVGMGSIGSEAAQALARLGLQVSAFGSQPFVAGLSDPAVNDAITAELRKEMHLHLGSPAKLSAQGDDIEVSAGEHRVTVDCVLASLGRQPNIEALGLENLGVPCDERGLPHFDRSSRQVADLPVYLAGDVAQDLAVLHEAADDGYIAGTNTTREEPICFERRTRLAIVFCDPNVAIVGTPYSELDQANTIIGSVSFERQGRATIAAENRGTLRIYAARDSGQLLGAELCAPRGEHLAHLLALAIGRELTAQDLLRLPYYHPVVEEGLRTALRDLSKQLGGGRESDLASCQAVGASALD